MLHSTDLNDLHTQKPPKNIIVMAVNWEVSSRSRKAAKPRFINFKTGIEAIGIPKTKTNIPITVAF